MKKTLLLVTLTIAAFIAAQAQELEVKEFNETRDLYAAQYSKNDFSLEPCGVIKLSLPDPNAKFEGDIMYDYLSYDQGEWIIYMSKGANYLVIKTDKYAPMRYVFPTELAIKSNVTYIMVIQMPKQMTDEEMVAYLKSKGFSISRDNDTDNDKDMSALVKEGKQYYDAKNYVEALRCYRQAAEQGDPEGQCNLGLMYFHGHGVAQNYSEAVKWFRKAADQNDTWAQMVMGIMYNEGLGVAQNDNEAVKWYRKAAEHGDSDAQNSLGIAYQHGNGVEKDEAEAVKWYRKAAEQDNAYGQANLGLMYELGKGVKQDYKEAVKWYLKAAEQGNAIAQYDLGIATQYGRGTEKDYNEAAKWYRKAANQGNADAQNALGALYYWGGRDWDTVTFELIEHFPQDYQEAIKWYRMAADQGDGNAQTTLGDMYAEGKGVAKNEQEALKWYNKAVEQGNCSALRILGYKYYYGNGIARDYKKAAELLIQSSSEKCGGGDEVQIGFMYYEGVGVAQDYKKAAEYFLKNVETDSPDCRAMHFLAHMYEVGLGVEQDYEQAAKWGEKIGEDEFASVFLFDGLAFLYHDAQRYEKFIYYAELADMNDCASARLMNMVGEVYEKGLGIKKDINEAVKWYRKAAEYSDDAKEALQRLGYDY